MPKTLLFSIVSNRRRSQQDTTALEYLYLIFKLFEPNMLVVTVSAMLGVTVHEG